MNKVLIHSKALRDRFHSFFLTHQQQSNKQSAQRVELWKSDIHKFLKSWIRKEGERDIVWIFFSEWEEPQTRKQHIYLNPFVGHIVSGESTLLCAANALPQIFGHSYMYIAQQLVSECLDGAPMIPGK